MDINKRIDELRFERGWSMYELAQETGLTQSTLSSIMKRGNPPKIETLQCICEAFGLTLAQFFLEDECSEILTQQEKKLIAQFRKLTYKQKQALLDFLEH